MRDRYQIAVVTNDICTREDAEFLVRSEALEPKRIVGVETGGDKPFVFSNLKDDTGLDTVIDFIVDQGMLDARHQRIESGAV